MRRVKQPFFNVKIEKRALPRTGVAAWKPILRVRLHCLRSIQKPKAGEQDSGEK